MSDLLTAVAHHHHPMSGLTHHPHHHHHHMGPAGVLGGMMAAGMVCLISINRRFIYKQTHHSI